MNQEREDRFVILRFEVLQSKDLSPSEKLVYARSCGFKKYFESKEECAEILGVSKETVVKAKQKLVKLGYIRELTNTGRGKIYQSVYDDNERVVKSTNQSGKKNLVRVVESTNIEERESKDRLNSVTVVTGETPATYGNPDINEMFDYWEQSVGYKIQARIKPNRNACKNLISKHGLEATKKLVDGAALAGKDKYAPRIADFADLQSKLNSLMAWGKGKTSNSKHMRIG